MKFHTLAAALLAAAAAACASETPSPGTAGSQAPPTTPAPSTTQAPSTAQAPAPSPAVEPEAVAAAANAWAVGDTISSDLTGVPDIEILEVRGNGTGPACGTGKTATLAYKAMKANGEVLDPGSRPFTFRVGSGQAIAGWDKVVARMRVGDSFVILMPEALAYRGRGDLKFEMELLSFK